MLEEFLADWPKHELLAVTMTGELCDCFPSRRDGVLQILDAVAGLRSRNPVRIWCNDARFVALDEARAQPLQVASANWLALAHFASRFARRGPALLIDVGSTTTDIVPLLDGNPVPKGRCDAERLRFGELVYLGARRTPLNVLLGTSGAAESFATMQDVLLVLGFVGENHGDGDTADGRPAIRSAAEARLARMICADVETSTAQEREGLATQLLHRWTDTVATAVDKVAASLPAPPETILLAGSGEFLAKKVLRNGVAHILSFSEVLGADVSTAACAYSMAVLAEELV